VQPRLTNIEVDERAFELRVASPRTLDHGDRVLGYAACAVTGHRVSDA
jgi:hypothetical protein